MVILINGSPREKGCTNIALGYVKEELEKEGIETRMYWVGNRPIQGCIACGVCNETGKCFVADGVNEINALEDLEGIIIGSPVYYAGPSGEALSFLDRLFYAARRGAFDGIPGAAVVSCRRGGATAAFNILNNYFTINSMPVVSSIYWNMVHGNAPEEVMEDHEGVETMKTLGRNFAYMVKLRRLGKEHGLEFPKRGKSVYTNFIR